MKKYLGLCVALLALVEGLGVVAGPAKSVRIVPLDQEGAIAKRAAAILSRQITGRCEAQVLTTGKAECSIELGLQAGIGAEGYRIVDGPAGSVRIFGQDERGLLYGVGKFLRSSRYDQEGFTPGNWRGTSVPQCSMRGIYHAEHAHSMPIRPPQIGEAGAK